VIHLRDWVDVMDAADLTEDSHGNVVPDWDNAPSVQEQAHVTPSSTLEIVAGQDVTVSRWKALLLTATTCDARSRVRWRSDTYEVDGEVQLIVDHAGRPNHCTATLKRAEG
jgi:hypothetical protein